MATMQTLRIAGRAAVANVTFLADPTAEAIPSEQPAATETVFML